MKKVVLSLLLVWLLSGCSANSAQNDTDSTFQPISVVENDSCTIKITGIQPETVWGYGVNVYLENKTQDKKLMFACESGSVNGVQVFPLLSGEVLPGKKANDRVTFRVRLPQGENLGEITDIALAFRVYDSEDILADDVAAATAHVYPLGQEKATRYSRNPKSTDTLLVDDENMTVSVIGYRMDETWGYTAQLYVENKTQQPLMVSVEEASVNGFMLDPFFATQVEPGACSFRDIAWSKKTLEENGITHVKQIQFTLQAYPADNIFAENILSLPITLYP